MDSLNSDLCLSIIQFLPAKDADRFSSSGKRYFYLVRSFQQLIGSELVASTSRLPGVRTRQLSIDQVCQDALQRLHAKPNVALHFGRHMYGNRPVEEDLPALLPQDTAILSVSANAIQSCFQGDLDYKNHTSIMLGSFRNVLAVPFGGDARAKCASVGDFIKSLNQMNSDNNFWKVFMIFGTPGIDMGSFQDTITLYQKRFPEATIVGGICESGHLSTPLPGNETSHEDLLRKRPSELIRLRKALGAAHDPAMIEKGELVASVWELMQSRTYIFQEIVEGVFGIVLGGDVPVRSVVSRGMRSLTFDGPPRPVSPFYIKSATSHRFGDSDYLFRGRQTPPYHLIQQLENRETGAVYTVPNFLSEFGIPELVGLRRPNEDGFALENFTEVPRSHNALLLFGDGNPASIVGANLDFFELDGALCVTDMEQRMRQLQEATKDEELLGALMITCSGRGPRPNHLIPEEMADARRFSNAFPHVPCLGFYAGGEVGPPALAGRQSAFQTGKAALQGFTAVFALFIVPKVDLTSLELDDRSEVVNKFVQEHFARSD